VNRDDDTKRKVAGLLKILEGEVALLGDCISEAMHWNEPSDPTAALKRIRHKVEQIALAMGLDPNTSS
jgi:hypothetical protein